MATINTHTLFKELVASGLPENTSEVISNAILNGRTIDNFATKEQIVVLEKEQFDIKTDIVIMKNDIAHIKANMVTKADQKADLIKLESDLTTKINNVRSDLTAEINNVRIDLTKEISNVKSDLMKEMGNIKHDILKWVIALFLTNMGLFVSVLIKVFL